MAGDRLQYRYKVTAFPRLLRIFWSYLHRLPSPSEAPTFHPRGSQQLWFHQVRRSMETTIYSLITSSRPASANPNPNERLLLLTHPPTCPPLHTHSQKNTPHSGWHRSPLNCCSYCLAATLLTSKRGSPWCLWRSGGTRAAEAWLLRRG